MLELDSKPDKSLNSTHCTICCSIFPFTQTSGPPLNSCFITHTSVLFTPYLLAVTVSGVSQLGFFQPPPSPSPLLIVFLFFHILYHWVDSALTFSDPGSFYPPCFLLLPSPRGGKSSEPSVTFISCTPLPPSFVTGSNQNQQLLDK